MSREQKSEKKPKETREELLDRVWRKAAYDSTNPGEQMAKVISALKVPKKDSAQEFKRQSLGSFVDTLRRMPVNGIAAKAIELPSHAGHEIIERKAVLRNAAGPSIRQAADESNGAHRFTTETGEFVSAVDGRIYLVLIVRKLGAKEVRK